MFSCLCVFSKIHQCGCIRWIKLSGKVARIFSRFIVHLVKLMKLKCLLNVGAKFDNSYHHSGLMHDHSILEATTLVNNPIIKEILTYFHNPYGMVTINQLFSRCEIGFMAIHIKHHGVIGGDLFFFPTLPTSSCAPVLAAICIVASSWDLSLESILPPKQSLDWLHEPPSDSLPNYLLLLK